MSENPSWEECKKATPCREFKIAASGALWRFFPPSGQQNIHKLKTIKKEPKQISQICPKTKDRVLARKHAPGARKNMVMARKDRDLSIQKAPKTCKRRTKKGRKTTQKKKTHTHKWCAQIRLGTRLGGFRAGLYATSANIHRRLGVESPAWSGKCKLLS